MGGSGSMYSHNKIMTSTQKKVAERLTKFGFKVEDASYQKCLFCKDDLYNIYRLKQVISPNGKIGFLKETIIYYVCLTCECFYKYCNIEIGKTIEEFALQYSENKLELLKEYKLKLLQACRAVQDDIDTLSAVIPVTTETFSYRQ